MTEADIQFVRSYNYKVVQEFRKRRGGKASFGDIAIDAEDNLRLLNLLMEAEAMTEKEAGGKRKETDPGGRPDG